MFTKELMAGDATGRSLFQRSGRIHEINGVVRVAQRRVFDGLINSRIGAESECVTIARQFEVAVRLLRIGQCEAALAEAKLEVGELRINDGGL